MRSNRHDEWGVWRFIYDPTASVPAVLVEDLNGTPQAFYVREPDGRLIAREAGENLQYYFFDLLGSTILMAPAAENNPTDRFYYTPWGQTVTTGSRASTGATTANPYRYVGSLGYYTHHQDANLADWMQLGVRFYKPELGRFERRDRVVAKDHTRYDYAFASPLRLTDPQGYWPTLYGGASCKNARYNTEAIINWVSASMRHYFDTGKYSTVIGEAVMRCTARIMVQGTAKAYAAGVALEMRLQVLPAWTSPVLVDTLSRLFDGKLPFVFRWGHIPQARV